ncbi:MAG: dTDP-4-dehydrorhamnose 3,5-epimerase family protein [Candidatus Odinarchaeota archaeon]
MLVEQMDLPSVLRITPDVHRDNRGINYMTYHHEKYSFLPEFVEHNIFTAKRKVLSGIHYSPNCEKLYQCLYGTVSYYFVNCVEDSPQFGMWDRFILHHFDAHQLYKPKEYGTAFICLSDYAVIQVFQSEYYDANDPNQITYYYLDKRFNIDWPILDPILSERDKCAIKS